MHTVETEVLVVGAGPAGLTASALLARACVPSLTVTKYGTTADAPRAHSTNQRAMEIFRNLGIEERVVARALPKRAMPLHARPDNYVFINEWKVGRSTRASERGNFGTGPYAR